MSSSFVTPTRTMSSTMITGLIRRTARRTAEFGCTGSSGGAPSAPPVARPSRACGASRRSRARGPGRQARHQSPSRPFVTLQAWSPSVRVASPLPHDPGRPEPVNPSPPGPAVVFRSLCEGLTEPGLKAPDPAAIGKPPGVVTSGVPSTHAATAIAGKPKPARRARFVPELTANQGQQRSLAARDRVARRSGV